MNNQITKNWVPQSNAYAKWAGVDLGGRTTGKTALAWMTGTTNHIHLVSAQELKCLCGASDAALIDWINQQAFDVVGIDAPLSLPDCTQPDYLFRPGDRLVGALSPFTIGELTARAIYLSTHIEAQIIEVYPKATLQMLGLPHRGYKKQTHELASKAQMIAMRYAWELSVLPDESDTFDALLALVATWHYVVGKFKNLSTTATPFVLPLDPPAAPDTNDF